MTDFYGIYISRIIKGHSILGCPFAIQLSLKTFIISLVRE